MIAATMSGKPAASWGRPFTLGYGPLILIVLLLLAGATGAAAHEPHTDDPSSSQKPTSTFTTTTRVTMTVTTRLAHRPTLAASHAGYALQGCYRRPAGSDSALENSTVPINTSQADALTVPRCLEACVGAGKTGARNDTYGFVTVGEGKKCYCGAILSRAAVLVDSKECSVPCAGDVRAACGGQGHVAVYSLTGTAAAVTAVSAASTSTSASASTGTGTGTGTGDPGFIGVKDSNPGPNPDPAPQKPQGQQQQQQQQQGGEPQTRAHPAAIAVGSLAGFAAFSGLIFLAWKLCARRQKKMYKGKGKSKEEGGGGLENREPTLPAVVGFDQQQQQQQQRNDVADFLTNRTPPPVPGGGHGEEVSPASSTTPYTLATVRTTASLEPRPSGDSYVVTGAARQRELTRVRFAADGGGGGGGGPAVVAVNVTSPTSPTGSGGVRHRRMPSSAAAAQAGWSNINTVVTDGRLMTTPTRDRFNSPGASTPTTLTTSAAEPAAAMSATSGIQNPALQYQAYQPPPQQQQQQQQGTAYPASASSSREQLVSEPRRVGGEGRGAGQQRQQTAKVENESPVLPGGWQEGGGSASKKAE